MLGPRGNFSGLICRRNLQATEVMRLCFSIALTFWE